jgi:glycosyltransferase involved in cell wall biosynthesis
MEQISPLPVVMKMNKFLIILAYYERPTIVLNALKSIMEITYPEFEVHFIDDGSTKKGEPIVREFCKSIIDKFTFHYVDNTIEQKKEQGGSIHGKYLNLAISQSDADQVIILCDDDAIYPDFLTRYNYFLNKGENKDIPYFYHNMILYDCLKEPYTEGVKRKDLSYFTNQWNIPIHCGGRVDSSQVTYSRKAFIESGLSYPAPQTSGLDMAIYTQMFEKWGTANYSGLISQVKSNNEDNLVWKDMNQNKDVIYRTKDMN